MRKDLPEFDFEKHGFKCGLEIHQQLDTKRKLYCRCPVGYVNTEPDATVLRHMRPTLSELGEYDGTALMEFKTRKNVLYELYRGHVCTYEMDDTPPFLINEEALDIAVKLCMLLNCNIVDELHVSRKQYLDGSIPTGFQRTAVVGVEGWIPYKNRKIRIIQVCLEEDACREMSDVGHDIRFRADRLGTPLAEVITYPDMRSPQEAMEVDALIGRLLKASGLVRRGIGSVRQDVNVSIDGGTRVEIKGVMKTGYIRDLTYIEALRQKNLLDIRDQFKARGISRKSLSFSIHDLSSSLANCSSERIRAAVEEGGAVKTMKIDGIAGLLNHPTQPGYTFAHELEGRIKVIACIDRRPNLYSTDDPESSDLSKAEWDKIKDSTGCKLTDTAILVWGPKRDVDTALDEVKFRLLEAIRGVSSETRQDIENGITDFERILPGPDRMYPDTDHPPMAIEKPRLDEARKGLPERAWERDERWRKLGLNDEIIRPLGVSEYAATFDRIVNETKVDAVLVGVSLSQTLKNLRRNGLDVTKLDEDDLISLFKAVSEEKLKPNAIPQILNEYLSDESRDDLKPLIDKYSPLDDDSLKSIVSDTVASLSSNHFKSNSARIEFAVGKVMEEVRGRAEGQRIVAAVTDAIG